MSDRKSRKQERLAATRRRLREAAGAEAENDPVEETGREVMYRGQVVRQAKGASARSSDDDVQAAIEELKVLYRDGLITRDEAEEKRQEILKRQ